MSNAPPPLYFEKRLQESIEDVEKRIKELEQEKLALQRQLRKARSEGSGLKDVNRKNSIRRAMIEARVLRALEMSSKPLHTDLLFVEARVVDFELNEATFRNQLHRMKNKLMIENVRPAVWRIK